MPAAGKDDRLNALAMAVNYHTERMDADAIKSLRDHLAEAMDKELDKFMEHVVGEKPGKKN